MRINWKWKLPGLALLALLGLVLTGPGYARAVKGQAAPDFSGATLDGRKVSLSDFRGKNPVVLNFYADFCGPCRQEFPHLKAVSERFESKGLRVVAVSLDENRQTASNLPKSTGVKFPVIFDPQAKIAEKYGVQAIPHTVVIDRGGKVHSVIVGLNLDALDRAVEQVLK